MSTTAKAAVSAYLGLEEPLVSRVTGDGWVGNGFRRLTRIRACAYD